MRVLLVFPPNGRRSVIFTVGLEPISLEYVAAEIKPYHDVLLLDMRVDRRLDEAIARFQPQVVGLSGFTHQYNNILAVARRIKELDPSILTVAGGIHANSLPRDFDREEIDVVVTGVNTATFRQVLERYEAGQGFADFADIAGVSYRKDGDFVYNPKPNPTASLDDLPLPDRSSTRAWRHLYSNRGKSRQALMRTSAGCTFRCFYCNCWVATRGKYLVAGVERAIEELAGIEENEIWFCDDEAFLDMERMHALADAIRESGIKKTYYSFVRADTARNHPDLIEKWRDIGLRGVNIGLEAFTDGELDAFNKDATIQDSHDALHILNEMGLAVDGYIICDPLYTEAEFERTRRVAHEWLARYPCLDLFYTIKTPFPGTVLHKQDKDRIIQPNYELFDVFHAVMPTRLPLQEYYLRFAQLWEESFARSRMSRLPKHNPAMMHEWCTVIANGWVAHEPVTSEMQHGMHLHLQQGGLQVVA